MRHHEKNVLVMSQATSEVVFDLTKDWASTHGTLTLHTGSRFEDIPSNINFIQAPRYSNKSYASRLRTWSGYMFHALTLVLRNQGQPMMVLSSNPPFLPWLGYLSRKLRGTPYIVHILDVYPDAVVKAGLLSSNNPVVRIWSAVNRLVYKNAAAVITLGPVMAETLAKYVPEPGHIRIIPYWADPDELKPIPKSENPFAVEHGQVDKLTVIYSGNYGLSHDLSGLLAAASSLQNDTDIAVMLVGGGSRAQEFIDVAETCSNTTYLPFQPEAMVPYAMACGDVGVVTLGIKSAGIALPSKAYYLMAAGCALLGLSKGKNDIEILISRYECGLNVESDDSEAVGAAILRFKEDPEFLARCRKNARKAAEEVFSSQVCKRQYHELLNELMPR